MEQTVRAGLAALSLPTDKAAPLCDFAARMLERNTVMNLTAITAPEEVATLHLLDCACLLSAADFAGKNVVDVGTGAGFPGMPLCILVPSAHLTLLDSLAKRISFLQETCDEMGLSAECVHARAEEFAAGQREKYDLAVSRAVASLPLLCELALPLVKVGGQFLAMKSVDSNDEIQSAARAVSVLGGRLLPSLDYTIPETTVRHRIVRVEKIAPTPGKYPRRFSQIKKAPL